MKRRDFIFKTTGAILAINTSPLLSLAARSKVQPPLLGDVYKYSAIVDPPAEIESRFYAFIDTLKKGVWQGYFKSNFNVDLDLDRTALKSEFKKELANLQLIKGVEDFAGLRMIEPGPPSMSLLYHILASPRITPFEQEDLYPELQHIDLLEDYIYSLLDLKIPNLDLDANYVFAVFSYEYRPAYKTPDGCCRADFVYSRTGISRIGECTRNYNRKFRSFTNKPLLVGEEKQIAVTPARYALFLAKAVPAHEVCLMSEERDDNPSFYRFRDERIFLQPVRKIFNGDPMLNGGTITFHESHVNEKLLRLSKRLGNDFPVGIYTSNKVPFIRRSFTNTASRSNPRHDSELVDIALCGSSVLLSSVPKEIIRVAKQDGKVICFNVPRRKESIFDSTRRYTSLKLQDHTALNSTDYLISEGIYKKYKPTRFSAPRNAPLFVNIRNEVSKNYTLITHLGGETKDFENKIENGGYSTAMFEDSICDGCVAAEIRVPIKTNEVIKQKFENCLPAFSLVTAPDFFPFVDSFDLEAFDEHGNSSFFEGGTENLSTSRLAANPGVSDPVRNSAAFPYTKSTGDSQQEAKSLLETRQADGSIEFAVSDTMAAIISGFHKPTNKKYVEHPEIYSEPFSRDYKSCNYLPDTASFIFAPGWDVTYSGTSGKAIYMSTFGLGSPFPEDMKLCAAANGMWPVSSPDAARTFQGSLAPLPILNKVTPTAIPLMDEEIGIHQLHPSIAQGIYPFSNYGWDGEQGPFFEKKGSKFCVNFTDIGRADYLENLKPTGPGFDMSLLRKLDCEQLIFRIGCLRKCKIAVEGRKPEFSQLWLVSAEEVTDWSLNARGGGIPINLVGNSRDWAIRAVNGLDGPGFLYIYADPIYEDKKAKATSFDWVSTTRRRIACKNIIVCQVNKNAVRWCKIPPSGFPNVNSLKWEIV